MNDPEATGYDRFREFESSWPEFKPVRVYLGADNWEETVSATTFTFLRDTKLQRSIPQKAKYFTEGGDDWPDRTVAVRTDWK